MQSLKRYGCGSRTTLSRRHCVFKDSGQAKARLVISGYHDPRIGGGVQTEAPVLSNRGRCLHLTSVAQERLELRKEGVKNAFLQGEGTGQDVELVAEPGRCYQSFATDLSTLGYTGG